MRVQIKASSPFFQGNKALVMKQYLSDEQVKFQNKHGSHSSSSNKINVLKVAEIDEILEMKITHRKNLTRRKAKFG